MTDAFADCFLVATILIAVCLVLAWFLPRSKPASGCRQSRDLT